MSITVSLPFWLQDRGIPPVGKLMITVFQPHTSISFLAVLRRLSFFCQAHFLRSKTHTEEALVVDNRAILALKHECLAKAKLLNAQASLQRQMAENCLAQVQVLDEQRLVLEELAEGRADLSSTALELQQRHLKEQAGTHQQVAEQQALTAQNYTKLVLSLHQIQDLPIAKRQDLLQKFQLHCQILEHRGPNP